MAVPDEILHNNRDKEVDLVVAKPKMVNIIYCEVIDRLMQSSIIEKKKKCIFQNVP